MFCVTTNLPASPLCLSFCNKSCFIIVVCKLQAAELGHIDRPSLKINSMTLEANGLTIWPPRIIIYIKLCCKLQHQVTIYLMKY